MKDNTSKEKLLKVGESAALGAMLTLATALMFITRNIDIPGWYWLIQFILVTGMSYAIPQSPRVKLSSSQKYLLLFSAISAGLLAIVLAVIVAVS